jgi:hypothetical protein
MALSQTTKLIGYHYCCELAWSIEKDIDKWP